MVKPKNVFEREETVSGWDTAYYHPIAERYYDRAVTDMLKAMGVRPGDQVLDAGCGPGVHSIRAARYGCQVTAIDLSEQMLKHARERSAEAGVADRIDFRQDDLTALSLASESFSHVFSWGVIIHIPETGKAIDNLCRVVKPGGRLGLQITNVKSLDHRLQMLGRRVLSKPLLGPYALQETEFGDGRWYDLNNDRLWVLRFDAAKLTGVMARRGFRLISRRAAEYTEFQTHMNGALRSAVLWGNRAAYAARFPAEFSCTQIMVFEKSS